MWTLPKKIRKREETKHFFVSRVRAVFSGKGRSLSKKFFCVLECFVFLVLLSSTNTQHHHHTITINSHSYFSLICLISLVKSTVCAERGACSSRGKNIFDFPFKARADSLGWYMLSSYSTVSFQWLQIYRSRDTEVGERKSLINAHQSSSDVTTPLSFRRATRVRF